MSLRRRCRFRVRKTRRRDEVLMSSADDFIRRCHLTTDENPDDVVRRRSCLPAIFIQTGARTFIKVQRDVSKTERTN